MFEKIIFWCEFPNEIKDWNKVDELLKRLGLDIDVYVACKSKKEYFGLERKIKKCDHVTKIGVWPVLPKDRGYWFSGQTAKEDIDRLKDFKGMRIKIDLEKPYEGEVSKKKLIKYFLGYLRKGENGEYLEKRIESLSKKSKVELIINAFPFPKFWLKRNGTFIDVNKYDNLDKNIMCYTTIDRDLRIFARMYKWLALNFFYWKYKEKLMASVGLIGTGILGNEGVYESSDELRQDLRMVNNRGLRKVAIYSLEGLMKRENPAEWMQVVKEFKS